MRVLFVEDETDLASAIARALAWSPIAMVKRLPVIRR